MRFTNLFECKKSNILKHGFRRGAKASLCRICGKMVKNSLRYEHFLNHLNCSELQGVINSPLVRIRYLETLKESGFPINLKEAEIIENFINKKHYIRRQQR